MKTSIICVTCIVVCSVSVWLLLHMSGSAAPSINEWLTVAGFIVTVSALSQVAFAIVAYVESAALRDKVREVTTHLELVRRNNTESMRSLNHGYCIAARASIQAMMVGLLNLDPGDEFSIAMKNLRSAQIEVELANGSYASLWGAMQNSLKLGTNTFLELQDTIWEKSAMLSDEDASRIKSEFRRLRSNLLRSN